MHVIEVAADPIREGDGRPCAGDVGAQAGDDRQTTIPRSVAPLPRWRHPTGQRAR